MADGYRYTGIESSRPSVAVNGLKSDLANINSITIPSSELNMDGATGIRKLPWISASICRRECTFGRVIQRGEGCHQGGGFGEQNI